MIRKLFRRANSTDNHPMLFLERMEYSPTAWFPACFLPTLALQYISNREVCHVVQPCEGDINARERITVFYSSLACLPLAIKTELWGFILFATRTSGDTDGLADGYMDSSLEHPLNFPANCFTFFLGGP